MLNALELLHRTEPSPFRNFDYWYQPTSTPEPNFDLREDEKGYAIDVDMPGVRKDDLKIDLAEYVLTVTGERKRDGKSLQFQRQFSLPKSVDLEKIEANVEDGVLHIAIPKAEKAKPRSIQISGK